MNDFKGAIFANLYKISIYVKNSEAIFAQHFIFFTVFISNNNKLKKHTIDITPINKYILINKIY